LIDFEERLDVFTLLRAGALVEGAITNWRFDKVLLLRLTFCAPFDRINVVAVNGAYLC
jgi:hypothetical protein